MSPLSKDEIAIMVACLTPHPPTLTLKKNSWELVQTIE